MDVMVAGGRADIESFIGSDFSALLLFCWWSEDRDLFLL